VPTFLKRVLPLVLVAGVATACAGASASTGGGGGGHDHKSTCCTEYDPERSFAEWVELGCDGA
jgi:hypothetical protein